jgi:pimeloyl-ACP methyl ester carboxylesterase
MAALAHLEQGRGAPLVFLHGVGGGAAVFQAQLDHFGVRRRAIAWDMPGYGGSAALSAMTFPALADALARLLDQLRIERADLIGHSMGGMVALEMMAAHADRCRSLALVATSPVFGSADGSFQRAFLAQRLGPLDEGRTMPELAPVLVADMIGAMPDPAGVARATAAMAAVSAASYRASLTCLTTFDRRALLATIALPTLVVAAEHDRAAPPAGMERMAARISGARYVCVPGASHLLPLERPMEFNRVLGDFLDALPEGT